MKLIREKEILGACIMTIKVATTGKMGGDSGHGGRTSLEINLDGGDMAVVSESTRVLAKTERAYRVLLEFGGDEELRVLTEGLEFAAKTLREAK